jgi:hypothetical protein
MQELDEIEGMRGYVLAFGSRFRGNELVADVMRATSRRDNDVLEAREELHKMLFRRPTVFFAARVRHRLTATGLIEGIIHFHAESFEQFECRDADFGKKRIDITRYDECYLQCVPLSGLVVDPTITIDKVPQSLAVWECEQQLAHREQANARM